jgi:hypothetical protein
MLRPIFDLQNGVTGYSAVGMVTADDINKVLLPEIEAQIADGGRLRFVMFAGPKFEGYAPDLMMSDAAFGFRHFLAFERIAFVSDNPAFRSLVAGVSLMMPSRVRSFAGADLATAKAWLEEN